MCIGIHLKRELGLRLQARNQSNAKVSVMKLGLITDIHEHVVTLRRALEHLAELRVDKIVMIGDVVEMGRRLEGTCQLLADAQVVGVWGNHDFGLCSEPEASVFSHISPRVRAQSPVEKGVRHLAATDGTVGESAHCSEPDPFFNTRAYMGTLLPRLVVEECHFSHVEPWLDPTKLEDLWHFAGKPSEHGDFSRIFAATPHRLMFAGHYHAWQVVTPERVLDWHGETPITLAPGRYFVVVGALCEGDYAVFDTETSLLTPLKVEEKP